MLLPCVLVWNRPAIEKRIAASGRYINLPDPSFNGFDAWLLELREMPGIPDKLGELGEGHDQVDRIAQMAAQDPKLKRRRQLLNELSRRFPMLTNYLKIALQICTGTGATPSTTSAGLPLGWRAKGE